MVFYALVAIDTSFAVDLYPTLEKAEQALRDALADEPDFVDLLSVVSVELAGASGEN